jgi:ubiquinone/menaquinone biosynthesis C-methylase UbiE
MSLRGRYMIDRMKWWVGHRLAFPVPPYGTPEYWDDCYRSLGPEDTMEWGHVDFPALQQYQYRRYEYQPHAHKSVASETIHTTTWGETLGVEPHGTKDEPILMLGCGTSNLGSDMLKAGWRGPLWQVDISSRLIDTISQRYAEQIRVGDMQCIQDDATKLTAFTKECAPVVIDKGLLDSLFCADEHEQCRELLTTVSRVLTPGGIFVWCSFSRPEFILESLFPATDSIILNYHHTARFWKHVEIRQLDSILLYRFHKAERPTLQGVTQKKSRR